MKQFKPVCIFGSALLCTVSNLNAQEIREPVPVSIGVPSGFGAAGGLVFGSVSYTDSAPNTGNSGDEDGSIGVGFGVGDPTRSFGVEFTVGITSVSSPFWGDGRFADEGNLNIKFHRIVDGLPGASYAAILSLPH